MEGTLTPTYSLNGGDGMGFNSGFWIIALIALMNGGFGGYGRGGMPATVEDLNTTSNFARMESQVRSNADLTERKADAISNGICSLGYEVANKFGETNALIIAENQKTRDLLQQNKIEALQGQINALQLAQATAGVVRYPNSTTYSVPSPCFCQGYGNI